MFIYKLVYIVWLCVQIHMYHICFISNVYDIFNVYNRYYYKGKMGCREKMHLKNASTVLIVVLNLLL